MHGISVEEQSGKCDVKHAYFSDLFQAKETQHNLVMELIHSRVSEVDNNSVLAPFSMEEFRVALMHMTSDLAPGLDGLNPAIYKHFGTFLERKSFLQPARSLRMVLCLLRLMRQTLIMMLVAYPYAMSFTKFF